MGARADRGNPFKLQAGQTTRRTIDVEEYETLEYVRKHGPIQGEVISKNTGISVRKLDSYVDNKLLGRIRDEQGRQRYLVTGKGLKVIKDFGEF